MPKRVKLIRTSTVPTSLATFCKGQLKMLSQHYEVVAVSSPGPELDAIAKREGVRTVAVPMERHISIVNDLKSLWRMVRVLRRERPTIVHSMTPKAGLISMMAAWLCRVPVRMHTYTGLVFPTATGLKQKILIFTDRVLCFCSNYINPEGRGVASDLKRYHITSKPLHIIGNGNVRGIDLNYWNPELEFSVTRDSFGLSADDFVMIFVGRLVGDKGINELVAAMRDLHSDNHLKLVLVGRQEPDLDPLKPDTVQEIEQNPCIIAVGQQNDVRPYYLLADCIVFPSYREGFPNTVLEAGAMGLPSIVTDINGCNEIVVNGENGLIIPTHSSDAIKDAIVALRDNPQLRQHMAARSRPMIASRYEQQQLWHALLDVYTTLTA